jgi:hypothetical protein
MNVKHLPLHWGLGFALALSSLVSGTPQAQAQSGNFSDITGNIITTSDIAGGFSPGGDRKVILVFRTGEIRDSVYNAANAVNQLLAAGNLPVVATGAPTAIPVTVQRNLRIVLTGTGDNSAGVTPQLESALVNAGSNPTIARNLASNLQNLTAGERVNAARFAAVVQAYNALINSSNAEFLRNPPEEFRAIQSVLSILLNAAYSRR